MTTQSGAPPEAVCLDDFEERARAALPADVWGFVAGGSGAEVSLAANRAAFDALRIAPRVLADVSSPQLAVDLLGSRSAMPVAVAPMAYQRLLHPDGELAVARVAKAAGIPYTVAMLSSFPLERIAEVAGSLWLQLYWLRDRGLMEDLIRRAEAVGCDALMLTVDMPRMARRLRDMRNGFTLPADVTAASLGLGVTAAHRGDAGTSAVAAHTNLAFDPSLHWRDVEWLRARTGLPLILKGILDPDDAVRAADVGAAAIVVSNHGGRQLDGAVSTIDALPGIRAALGERCQILLDSGVRGGIDVLKAVSRGASGVLLGRPVLWGMASGGEDGVERVLSMVREEFIDAMVLAGCADIPSIQRLKVFRTAAP